MPRNSLNVRYEKAKRTPSKRQQQRRITLEEFHESWIPPLKEPQGLSPLARYIYENQDSGLEVQELIEQFQEYDCSHSEKNKIITGHKEIFTCVECGLVEVKVIR